MVIGLNGNSKEAMYSTKMIAEAMDRNPDLVGERRKYVKWIRENLNGRDISIKAIPEGVLEEVLAEAGVPIPPYAFFKVDLDTVRIESIPNKKRGNHKKRA